MSQNGTATVPPESLIEVGIGSLAAWKAKRPRKVRTGPSWLARAWHFLSGLLGTLLALTSFTVAAFMTNMVLGLLVLGVSFLLLDTKITVNRRAQSMRRTR